MSSSDIPDTLSALATLSGGLRVEDIKKWKESEPLYFDEGGKCKVTLAPSNRDRREGMITSLVTNLLYDFVKPDDSDALIYYKEYGSDDWQVYKKDSFKKTITKICDKVFGQSSSSEVSNMSNNIQNHIDKVVNIRNGVIKLMDNFYWDSKKSIFLDKCRDSGCFIQLDGPTKLFSDDPEKYKNIIKDEFNRFYTLLELKSEGNKAFWQFYEDLPVEFQFIKNWADPKNQAWTDRYWDMMMTLSAPFMSYYIKKCIALLGTHRSAKSTTQNILLFEFGKDNTADVKVSDFANWSINGKLAHCVLNMPDEEKDKTMVEPESCALFKTLVTHKGVVVSKKQSSDGIYLDGGFLNIIALNRPLNWSPGSAESCSERMIYVRFTNYFGKNDTEDYDFIRDELMPNPEMYAKLLGVRLAMAKYFSQPGRQYFISEDSKSVGSFVSADGNSIVSYKKLFDKYFDGVATLDFHYDDYRNCCSAFGWTLQAKSDFRNIFIALHCNKPVPLKVGGHSVRAVRVPKFRPARILYPGLHIDGHGDADWLHKQGQSVVAIYKQMEDEEKEKKEEDVSMLRDQSEKYLGKKATDILFGKGEDDQFS